MLIPIPYVHAGIGLVTVVLSIPLMLRKVAMNRWYGIRIPKAFISPHNWYELNAYGGGLLFLFGIFLLVFTWIGRGFAPAPSSAWAPVYLIAPLLLLVPVFAMINAFAKRLPDR